VTTGAPLDERDLAPVRRAARAAWAIDDPARKCAAVERIGRALAGAYDSNAAGALAGTVDAAAEADDAKGPGRPPRPRLVSPAKLPQRSMASPEGRAALLHAIAHIEFNAINLALDAAWRFERMPAQYRVDWLSVAVDEARHFRLIERLLRTRGFAYGEFDAHDGLWEMAERTRDDVLDRMALVPRLLEARGLDATPPIQAKLRQAGDDEAADALAIILDEEVRHVAIGNRWFRWLCEQRGLDPLEAFRDARARHRAPRTRGPINRAARLAAGFSARELDTLGE